MSFSASVTLFSTLLAVGAQVRAQEVTGTYPATPLAEKTFAYNDLPYQVDTDTQLIRGKQFGYNLCNETTAGQDSLCQTSIFNAIDDFCLWAPPELDIIANTEGEEVAWCTKEGYGTRMIPEGTLTGLQLIETDEYFQLVGFIKGPNINIEAGDPGGELDPHGADLRGNPLGGLMYSSAFSGNMDQIFEWHLFIGADAFCFRICKPTSDQDASYCQHIYDRIGCSYNDPNDAQDGEFSVCKGDVGLPPGIYLDGTTTMTYTQPDEALGAISTMPYTATVPPYSECTTYQSTELFAALATVGVSGSVAASGAEATATGDSTRTTSRASGTASSDSAQSTSDDTDSAVSLVVGGFSIMGVVFSALFLS